jgi:hypothetical protein
MLNTENTKILKLIAHQVGNKQKLGDIILSKKEMEPSAEMQEILKAYFLNSFKDEIYFRFAELDGKLMDNQVFVSAKSVFENPLCFEQESAKLATYLYDMSVHPLIKDGEFYVVLFENCVIDDEIANAIGFYKSENKDTFLKVRVKDDTLELSHDNGININKLDKGCLVFNTEANDGFKVCMVDISGRSKEANYWKDSFLQLEQRKDNYYQTQNHMDICKGFVKNVYNANNGVEKADQIELLNKASDYFQSSKAFNLEDFRTKVISDDDVFGAFRQYRERVAEDNGIETQDVFDISGPAVKKGKAQLRSVLKLDKNFHIYIHGDRSKIVKGFDDSVGLHYYKVYYETEN